MTDTTQAMRQDGAKSSGRRVLYERLFEPIDNASITVFRMCFGAILFWEVWRYFEKDWIRKFYIIRTFYFKFIGFEWVHPWPGDFMYVHFAAVGVFALCVMTGFFYRIASWLLFLGIAFWFLLDQTRYLNHLYLTVLLAFLMAVIPAHRAKSIDARRHPNLRSDTVPTWCLWLLRFQVGLVYFFGGVAKLNTDWLLGEPLRHWLSRNQDFPIVGSWFETESSVWFFTYGGLLFDLAVVPALLWRKTRVWAFVACLFFHSVNSIFFNIGIFPILMFSATLLLLPPNWPRKVFAFFSSKRKETKRLVEMMPAVSKRRQHLTVVFLAIYFAIQLCMPLRHFLYAGNVLWTEEGHRFAWRMKLRRKRAIARFYATDPTTGKTWQIDDRKYLSYAQRKRVGRWPDMCLQFAHYMADELKKKGYDRIEIRVKTKASLNYRAYQYLIDPNVDLSKVQRNLRHANWILPLKNPLPGIGSRMKAPVHR